MIGASISAAARSSNGRYSETDGPSAELRRHTKAIAKDPSCTRAYLFRAKLLKRDNKLREAATDFDAVLKREPDNKEAKSELNLLKLFVRR